MKSPRRGAWLAALLWLRVAGAAESGHSGPPVEVLAAAWRAGDARAVTGHCTRAGRVQLELRQAQGSYGAAQLEVVLARLFAALETRALTFEDEQREAHEETAFARAEWRHRARDGGVETRETLTFALHLEGNVWRVVEIRSSP